VGLLDVVGELEGAADGESVNVLRRKASKDLIRHFHFINTKCVKSLTHK